MEEFNSYLMEYSTGVSPPITPNERIPEILNMKYVELETLSSEECLQNSYELTAHIMYLQKELSENHCRLSWCENVISWIISKEYNNFDPYLKYDIRRQSIINGNSFAEQVEKLRSRIQVRVSLLEGKLGDLRQMVKTLEELSKRKAYR